MTGNGTEQGSEKDIPNILSIRSENAIEFQKHLLPSMGREKAEHGSTMCLAGKLVESEMARAVMAWPFRAFLT